MMLKRLGRQPTVGPSKVAVIKRLAFYTLAAILPTCRHVGEPVTCDGERPSGMQSAERAVVLVRAGDDAVLAAAFDDGARVFTASAENGCPLLLRESDVNREHWNEAWDALEKREDEVLRHMPIRCLLLRNNRVVYHVKAWAGVDDFARCSALARGEVIDVATLPVAD